MSTTIDQRVVEMRFDNKQFENNIQDSSQSIDRLKGKLNFTGASKGLEDVGAAAKNVNVTGLGSAVETVQAKFSALQVMAVTALANITNSAMNAGKRIVSALTIDPIKTGFSEYETKINAIQTIMSNTSSKGTTMEDVTRVIGELNTYADKTIYNFAEMTRNIGTFTAAGVGLGESASAIQGIANLAAASGSNSQQASTAMYQLSQALASGTVKLMDWNSVVNAGMGGQKFQDALKATAKDHGVAVDSMIKKHGSFRESLSEGWITAEILNETLSKFTVEGAKDYANSMMESGKWTREQADALIKEAQAMEDAATKVKTFTQLWDTLKESAQSGWSQTWEIIVGDFEEAKETLTKFSDVIGSMIGASADARNELLQGWKDAGGRTDLIDSLYNVFEGIMSIVKPIKDAFREIFPPITVKQLVAFTRGLKDLTAKFKLSEETSNNLKRTFKGLFAIVDIAKTIIVSIVKAIGSLFGSFGDLGDGIMGVTAKIGDFLVKIRNGIKASEIFDKVLQGVVTTTKFVFNALKNICKFFGEIFKGAFSGAVESIDAVGDAFENWGLLKVLKTVWNSIKTITAGIMKAVGKLMTGITSKLGNGDFAGILEVLNGLITGGVGVLFGKLLYNMSNIFKGVGDVVDGVSGVFDGLGDVLQGFTMKVKADALLKIAIAVAVLGTSLLMISFIESDKLYDSIIAIGALFAILVGSIAAIGKVSGDPITGLTRIVGNMIAISVSVLILASALKKIASFDTEQLAGGLIGVGALMFIVVKTMGTLGGSDKTVIKGATSMIILATAIKILASVCEDLAYLSWEELIKGLMGVGVLIAEVSLFMSNTTFNKKAISNGVSIVLLAAAIKILASACEDFAQMEWGEIAKGLVSVGVLLAGFVIFTKTIGNTKGLISAGLSLIAIAASMKIFASALQDMATMTWEELARGLMGMAGALVAVVAALVNMPDKIISKGVGLIAIATALLILSEAMNKLGGMSWESIAKGFIVLGGSLAMLAVGLRAMQGTAKGSGALIVATMALGMLTPTLLILGAMSWQSIAKGLLALAGAFVIIGVAGTALSSAIPAILGLAGAMALIGAGILMFGVGLVAAGAGLSAIAVGVVAVVGALAGLVSGIISIISAVITGILTGIANGIIAFCKIIIEGVPAIGEAIKVVILTLCDVIIECIPVVVDVALKLVVSLLDSLIEYTPKIVEALFRLVIGILESLKKHIPTFIVKIFEIIGSLFTGVIEALKSADPSLITNLIMSVGLMAGVMAALAAVASLTPLAMKGVLGMGLVVAELALVLAALGALSRIPGLNEFIEDGGDFLQNIGNAIGGFVGGIMGGIAEGVTASFPQIAEDLSTFMTNLQPFIEGSKQIDSSALDGVKSLVGVILALTGASILEGLTSWITGGSSLTKFGEELASFGPNMKLYADAVCGIDAGAVAASATAAKALAEMASVVPNEGGMIAWFAGENSVSKFGTEIIALGQGLKGFSDNVAGIVPENIIAAANAAKVLSDMTSSIPNEGGVAAWFAGDNSISKFGEDIISLGRGLKGFSDEIAGVVPENIVAASNAAKALAEMTTVIPDSGGLIAWITGENSISKFGNDIVLLGKGLKGFSDNVAGIVPENVIAGANAAKALAEMTSVIPDSGGMVTWFVGDNSISKFAGEIPRLGKGLKGFSDNVAGIVPENVIGAANAAKALAEMTAILPNEGGIKAWFAGETSVSKFGTDIVALGSGLKGFSDNVAGINPENVTAAANAAKTLGDMTAVIPPEGGIKAWFAGETSMSKFSLDMISLGAGLKGFSDNVAGVVPENVVAAANAAKALGEMTSVIPPEGGIKAWFAGETNIASFADKLPTLGSGLKGFSDNVAGIVPENVTAAANAAKSLAEMADTVPKKTDKIVDFGDNLADFGKSLSSYFSEAGGISGESISASNNAIEAVKKASELEAGSIKSTAKAIDELIKSIRNMGKITKDAVSGFTQALKEMGEAGSEALLKPFKDVKKDMEKAGKEAMKAFIKGVEGQLSSAKKACKQASKDCADAVANNTSSWRSAGRQCVAGFILGIDANIFKAKAKAKAMAKAALKAAEEALGIASPSKAFYKDGKFAGQGFVNALSDYASISYDVGYSMANSARSGLSEAISRINNLIDGNIDSQPTIRPVLDLSDVRSGVNTMSGMLNIGSAVGVSANVSAIGSMMNRRVQNGANEEVVSAIDKLRKDLGNVGNTTYSINGLSYSGDADLDGAFKTIIRAAKMERRV